MARTTDKPKWIWMAAESYSEDFYLRARRTFTLGAKPAEARLRITALSDYVLYVNGRYVGRGPAPATLEEPLLDVYAGADLPLVRGRNVIAVLAHNLHVGLARRPRLPGGLWLELVVTGERGGKETIATDHRWRLAPAEDFSRRAPRLYWTAGFAEVRDTRREPKNWTAAAFSDKRWAEADEVHPESVDGAVALRPRERAIPRLAETFVQPRRVAATGVSRWPKGVTAIPFEFTMPYPSRGEFYAGTFVHSKVRQKARLVFDCDESAAIYVNNRQVIRQGYSEDFLRWLEAGEQDEYGGIHRGQGRRVEAAEVLLEEGWNSVGVVIYDPGASWGFAVRLDNPRTGESLPVEYSPDMKTGRMADWQVVCEQLCPCSDGSIPETLAPNDRTFPDPAYQLAWEEHLPSNRAARGARSLCVSDAQASAEPAAEAAGDPEITRRSRDGLKGREGSLILKDGEFVVYDFDDELVGYPELEVEGPAGAILDLAWAEGLEAGQDLAPVRRQADRFILAGGRQTLRLVGRRALRRLTLVARSDGEAVTVYRVGVSATGRMAEPPAGVTTDDAGLGAAIRLAGRTIRACMQDTLEGSPGRDAEQSIPAAFFLSQAERMLLGRTEMGEAALRAFAADQAADGFFRGVVPSGVNYVVPDWNLLWVIWMAEHVFWMGDKKLAAELHPVAERCLDWEASMRDSGGLLENKPDRSPWWLFLDFSPIEKKGVVTAWQALYVRALRAAADVAEFLGNEDAAEHGRKEARAVVAAARDRLWSTQQNLFVDCRLYEHKVRRASPETNYYALWGGLASDEQAEQILAAFWRDFQVETVAWGPHETPYVRYFALEALLERGRVEQALAIIRRYFGAMSKAGLVTVPEIFPAATRRRGGDEDGMAHGPYGSLPPVALCHAWGAYPPALAAKWILGVQPGKPGFEVLHLAPMPGSIERISGRVWTPRGFVEVSIQEKAGHREVRAVLPEGMAYKLDRRHLAKEDEVEVTGGRQA
jgi:hypothetical protein